MVASKYLQYTHVFDEQILTEFLARCVFASDIAPPWCDTQTARSLAEVTDTFQPDVCWEFQVCLGRK